MEQVFFNAVAILLENNPFFFAIFTQKGDTALTVSGNIAEKLSCFLNIRNFLIIYL